MAMSKLNITNKALNEYDRQSYFDALRQIQDQVNNLSEGKLKASYTAQTSVPTTGTYNVGDFVRNSAPSELGTAGNKYVLVGWLCSTSPTTFVQQRVLTGN